MKFTKLIITTEVVALEEQALDIKEDLAMYLERWGDSRVVSVERKPPAMMEQLMMGGMNPVERPMSRVRR